MIKSLYLCGVNNFSENINCETKKICMYKLEIFKLIDGHFSAKDGREILSNVFSSKIQFHSLQNFSSQERFGKDDEIALKRIPELRQSLEQIRQLIEEAERNGEELEIKSEVHVWRVKADEDVRK